MFDDRVMVVVRSTWFSAAPLNAAPLNAVVVDDEGGAEADQRLLARALAGDEGAWRCFYQRYHRLVSLAVARVLTRHRGRCSDADLADLSAEVWVALLSDDRRRLRRYDPARCRLATWLRILATHCTIDQLRVGEKRRPRGDDEALGALADERPRAEERLVHAEQAELARRALASLKAQERRFVACCLDDERETHELARELGISVNTVHSRKFKIRQKLIKAVRRLERTPAHASRALA